jgi:tRNA(Ile2) C34 agmatinyltransferase TiaS
MRVYVCFDDTDNKDAQRGTGKLARWFEQQLPAGCTLWGVIRQQLLVDDRIPYTSHNSSACAVVDCEDPGIRPELIARAVAHLEKEALPGSDPGLCVACEDDPALRDLIAFGKACTARIATQKEALQAARGVHLSGHGGTNDGIIGAAAGIGLTASGWVGRFIEYRGLRNFPDQVSVEGLEAAGLHVVSLDRDSLVPAPHDMVDTKGWLRPRLWGFRPVVAVTPAGDNLWESTPVRKREKQIA